MNSPYILGGLAFLWLLCGVLPYGWWLAYFQREYPALAADNRGEDIGGAFLSLLFGPIALISDLTNRNIDIRRHGWIVWPPKVK